ncbi:MAG: RtcB family protein [Candidatus Omnitrophica bacterium]|nr:RtcB family protein [Candidatus Omnitrophota bacterium]
MADVWDGPLEKIDGIRWRIPRSYKKEMRVDGIIYADDELIESVKKDRAPEQVVNVACLPGIVKHSLAMPDIHWGYGAPIGAVAAFDVDKGIVSPGITGYDINCGVRLVRTNLFYKDISGRIKEVIERLFENVPSGLGSHGKIKVDEKEMKRLLLKGASWVVEKGYGTGQDLEFCEERGAMSGADPSLISPKSYQRGRSQIGTLGSGNHFLEVQRIDEVYDEKTARLFGLEKDGITVMIHSGSRGFGYQVCEDSLGKMRQAAAKYKITLSDRQLACAPVKSPEGQDYLASMRCAANYAWANRQYLMHLARVSFEMVFKQKWPQLGMNLIYDVTHNIAKIEKHVIDGVEKTLCVHRKGATRAFPPGKRELPDKYKQSGQPVIIPGDMGTHSYLLAGTEGAEETFYSTCHGAGRLLSRTEAKRRIEYKRLKNELEEKGIVVIAHSPKTLIEEAPQAYKDINRVVDIVERAGISKKVCRMTPLGVIKG